MEAVRALWRWVRARPGRLTDLVVTAYLACLQIGSAIFLHGEIAPPNVPSTLTPVGVAGALLATLPLVVRRAHPLPVLGLSALGTTVMIASGMIAPAFGLVLALWTVGAYVPRRQAIAALVAVLALTGLVLLVTGLWELSEVIVLLIAIWVTGDRQRTHRAYLAELEDRAARLERERDDRDRLAVAAERSRIARELHDVVAHSVSVMVVQAGAARRNLMRHPDRAEDAIREVEQTGRQSLTELRRLLGLLRDDDAAGELAPQPHLEELGDLVEQFRAAGLPVRIEVTGDPRPLPSGVDLSVYRIVQEALTNALKHAEASRVLVGLRYGPDAVTATVEDDGRGASMAALSETGGQGLVGMRERAALLGGDLTFGPRADGGFHVSIHLPA